MSEPTPAEAVEDRLSVAGIYGDPAGASEPSVPLDLSAAQATQVDVAELLARIQKMEAATEEARVAALPDPPEAPRLVAETNAPGWMHDAFALIEARLSALEG